MPSKTSPDSFTFTVGKLGSFFDTVFFVNVLTSGFIQMLAWQ